MTQAPDPQALYRQAVSFHQNGLLAEAERLYRQLIGALPLSTEPPLMLAMLMLQQGRNSEALALMDAVLKIDPGNARAHGNYGNALKGLGRREEALMAYDKALAINPDATSLHYNRALLLHELNRLEAALAGYEKVLARQPDFVDALYNRGVLLMAMDRDPQALASLDLALAHRPEFAEAWNSRGNVLRRLGRNDEALASFNKAAAIRPDYANAIFNRGDLQRTAFQRFDEALADYESVLALKPDSIEALFSRGVLLSQMNRDAEALASIDAVLSLQPDSVESWNNRGSALQRLRRYDEAVASFDKALAIKPDFAQALYNRGTTLGEMNRFEAALESHDKALAIKPDFANALNNRGAALEGLHRFEEALNSYERARALDPDHIYAFNGAANAALHLCDWTKTAKFGLEMAAHIAASKSVIQPMTLLGYNADAALQFQCAKRCIQDKIRFRPPPAWNRAAYRHGRIRIAYLSADFGIHPVAYSLVELIERHDRSRFAVTGFSLGPGDGSEMHKRLSKAFDGFHEAHGKDSHAIAEHMRNLEVDIAIDLNGHTQGGRLDIFAHRAAPVQVNYLGYPGTTGAEFMDYVVADKIVLPFEQQPCFTEKIVHLPDCYFLGPAKDLDTEKMLSRAEAGLPELPSGSVGNGFIFCCFNSNWKITAPMFDIWMRLLRATPDSVLWLSEGSREIRARLDAAARARGIDPGRLVFAPRLQRQAEHLARHRLADLFLDTLPYNAHATASDALWTGLPMITCKGESFAGRVAASILHAAGLPELVTQNLEEYEALALRLARDGELLKSFRLRLSHTRLTSSLFDADRFRRNIEAAYAGMLEIAERGENPKNFSVAPR